MDAKRLRLCIQRRVTRLDQSIGNVLNWCCSWPDDSAEVKSRTVSRRALKVLRLPLRGVPIG